MKELQTIDETLKYLQFDNWEQSEPGLSRSYELLGLLGNPQEKLKFVHIAGTNGKGSTAAMLASVLQSAGYRTGLYTSPHLLRFHERMRVNGEEIDDNSLISLTNTVRNAAERMSEMPTGFEIMTAIAFLYFVQEQCDIVALEVGLGGRMDSTNVIPAPEVCVVANIGLEHTAILGDTVEKIAAEKCGIIKHGSHAVLFGQSEGVENVAREKCAQEDVALTITAQEKLERISSSLDGQAFKYRGRGPYHLRLLGEYQLLNALTVIDVCNALRSRGWDKLTDEAIDEGLSHAQWPGRLELLRRGPDFIVDGAHNPQCVDALMDSLAALYGDKKLIFLTGVLRDKDWQQMLRRALPLAKAFVVITPPSARALDENELAGWLNAQGVPAIPAADTDDGVRRALAQAGAAEVRVQRHAGRVDDRAQRRQLLFLCTCQNARAEYACLRQRGKAAAHFVSQRVQLLAHALAQQHRRQRRHLELVPTEQLVHPRDGTKQIFFHAFPSPRPTRSASGTSSPVCLYPIRKAFARQEKPEPFAESAMQFWFFYCSQERGSSRGRKFSILENFCLFGTASCRGVPASSPVEIKYGKLEVVDLKKWFSSNLSSRIVLLD